MGQRITKVLPGLYIGANENARNDEILIANGISHILSVQSSATQIEETSNHMYHSVFLGPSDGKCLLKVIPETNEFIHDARSTNGNVLVHSESGVSSNVAVVAAYLMTIYNLESSIAVSTLQGLVNAAQPIETLLTQLYMFGRSEEPNGNVTANVDDERKRLLEKFGDWKNLETDKKILIDALSHYNSLRASGAFLIGSGESRPPRDSANPKVTPGATPPPASVPRVINADADFSFDDLHEDPDDADRRQQTSPPHHSNQAEDGGSDGDDDDGARGAADEDDIVGSMPIGRGIGFRLSGSHFRQYSASYRPPPVAVEPAAAAATRREFAALETFEMAEDVAGGLTPLSSTVPAAHGIWRPR